jgi:hypothetical protein
VGKFESWTERYDMPRAEEFWAFGRPGVEMRAIEHVKFSVVPISSRDPERYISPHDQPISQSRKELVRNMCENCGGIVCQPEKW